MKSTSPLRVEDYSLHSPHIPETCNSRSEEVGSFDKGKKGAERMYGITYHISSSPYYSEDIHTNYPRVLLKGVMTQG
jgi:hypothetical protein